MLFAVEIAAWQTTLGILIIAVSIWAVVREWEVRLVLAGAGLLLGVIAWSPEVIVREFLLTMTNERFVIPLCTAMGFAHVLKHTGCDQHLVHLLVRPLTKVRFLLIPGTVVVGFLVNMPIVSQTSTAVTIGTVVLPILRAARLSPVTAGASLLLGASIGGELLNPGAPELQTTSTGSERAAKDLQVHGASIDPSEFTLNRCVERIFPLNLVGLAVGTLAFWVMQYWREPCALPDETQADEAFEVHWHKAVVPLVPLAILYITAYPFELVEIEPAWVHAEPTAKINMTRLIGLSMLIGVAAAAIASPGKLNGVVAAFFEGGGYGYAHIVSLIAVATCFGKGVEQIGIAGLIGNLIEYFPDLLIPLAGVLPLGFAALCGSGMATAQSLFGFFAKPALLLGVDPTHVGAVVSIAAAAGRTMSPVAAVTLMCARMTDTKPLDLSKQVVIPLLISIAIVIVVAMIIAPAV
jgi:DcuC family C4-dicarboxylate transporter